MLRNCKGLAERQELYHDVCRESGNENMDEAETETDFVNAQRHSAKALVCV